jgi:predicted nucleotidyltransferase
MTKGTTLEQLAVIVCEHLKRKGVDAVLTGGAVVSFYTKGEYQSFDLDFVTHGEGKKIRAAMGELGFSTGKDRYFVSFR